MTWFYDLKITTKLLLSFASILVLTLLLGAFSIAQLERVNGSATEINTKWLPSVRTVLAFKNELTRLRSDELQHILLKDTDEMNKFSGSIAKAQDELQKNLALYGTLISDPEERTVYERVKTELANYMALSARIVALSSEQKKDEALAISRGESLKIGRQLVADVDRLAQIDSDGSASSAKSGAELYGSARIRIGALLVVMIVLGFGLALWIARIVSRPLGLAPCVRLVVASEFS